MTLPPEEIRLAALHLIIATAAKYQVPPAYITAHVVEPPVVNTARKEVQRRMLLELGMRRFQIAAAFGRSLRRVRASVIGA